MVATRILGARVIDPSSGRDEVSDIFLQDGRITAIGQAPAGFEAQRSIDAQGLIAAPGLVDLSVALREPGYSRKGSIASENLFVRKSMSFFRVVIFPTKHQPRTPHQKPFRGRNIVLERYP